jgi:hypothetical protein
MKGVGIMKIFIVTMEMLNRDYEDDALMEWIFNDKEKAMDFYTKLNKVYFPGVHDQYSATEERHLAQISINERTVVE